MTDFVLKKELQKYLEIYFNSKKNCNCKDISNICDHCYNHINKVQKWIEAGIPIRYFDLDLEVLKNKNTILNKNQYMLKLELYNNIKKYIENLDLNFAQGKGILICGDFGIGKTTALMNIAKEAVNRKKNIEVTYMTELIERIYNGNSIINEIPNLDAIFIEDFTNCYVKKDSNFVDTIIDSILSLCIKYNVSLFITSNYDKQQLNDRLTPHAFSLLHEICDFYSLEGIDFRKSNAL